MSYDSTVAVIPQENLLEAVEADPEYVWTYFENQDRSDGGYIAGDGQMRSERLAEYLSAFEDIGFEGHVSVFEPDELGDSLTVVMDAPVERQEYEERVGGIDFVPGYEEIPQTSSGLQEITFLDMSPEVKSTALDYL